MRMFRFVMRGQKAESKGRTRAGGQSSGSGAGVYSKVLRCDCCTHEPMIQISQTPPTKVVDPPAIEKLD